MSARILVVDDVAANRQLLRAKLEARYFDVCEAKDGHEALKRLETYSPDIILLDVMMPGMDGYETCRRIKADPVTSFVPVVMITALSDRSERLKGLMAGAEDFLTKPVNDLALFTRIDALMRYNSVATELRERQASGERVGFVSDISSEELDKPASIILVDANPYSNDRLKRILTKGHHKVENPMSGQGDPSPENVDAIIISSVKQPFDPLKLCAKFRMTPDYRSISVLMIANETDEHTAYEALNLGASDIIFSPIDSQELLARVSTQLRRKRYIDILRRRVDRGLELAVVDPLTGLYNRRFLDQQMEKTQRQSVRDGATFAVVMIDIDHFKKVNDTYGHEAGDRVLHQFGDWLKNSVRPLDTVCRLGGEEFTILMPNTSRDSAFKVADRIRNEIENQSFCIGEDKAPIGITISAGVSSSNADERLPDEIIAEADAALYSAKLKGRNRVITKAA